MMDLSKLSDKDLEAIASGKIDQVSTAGLQIIAGEQPRPQRSRAEELLRQLGLTARAGIEGGLSLSSMVANVPYAVTDVGLSIAKKLGADVPTLAERGISATRSGQIIADILGLPKPETQLEQGVQSIAQAMGGAGTTARLTEALASRAVAPSVRAMTQQGTQVAQRVAPALEAQAQLQPSVLQQTLQTLSQSPLAQVLAGGTAASATEAIKEMGGGTGAQLAAGLLGGAMIPGGVGGAATSATGRAVRETVRPYTEAGREVIAGNVLRSLASDAERAILAAEGYQPPIPGYRPTTTQATRDIGLASAETAIRSLDESKGKFAQQQIEANRARMAILDRLAKDKEALEKAVAKRDEVTAPMREEAFLKAQSVDPQTFQSAVALTVDRTIDNILSSDVGARGTVIKTMNWAKDQLSRGTTPARLYEVRKDLRDAAQGLLDKEGAAYSLAKRELEQVIRSVDDAIEAAAPGYQDYLSKYAKSSKGIERLEAAQEFRGKVMSTIPDPSNVGEYLISQPSFTRAIRAAAEDTKLSKTQLAVLQRVSQDLDSGVLARAAKIPGSDTFKNLSTANIIGGIVGKQMFGEVPPALQKMVFPMKWLYDGSDDAIRQLLVDAMLDPQLAAKMMRKATQATVEPLSEELKKKALAGGLGTAFGLE